MKLGHNKALQRTGLPALCSGKPAAEFERERRAWRVTWSVKARWPGMQRRRQGEGKGVAARRGLKEAHSKAAGR